MKRIAFRIDTETKRFLKTALCVLLIYAAITAFMAIAAGIDPMEYRWPSYRLQAQAWLKGETALDKDYSSLELAICNGKYYVSFPPVPSIPYVLLIPLFGDRVSGGLLQKLYLALALILVLSELMRTKRMNRKECAAWTIAICLASAMFPISLIGGVWFEAEMLAFLFSTWAVIAVRRRQLTRACIFWALSIGCRPFTVCMGPVLLTMYITDCRKHRVVARKAVINLIPGICVGMAIAGAYMWYNYIRFGDPLEFGHDYLPEFTRSAEGQFSLSYVAENLKTILFGSPILKMTDRTVTFNIFGFSMFLSIPLLIIGVIWVISDIIQKRMTIVKWTIVLMGALNVFLLAMHRTVGGWQFGLRYALELVPMCFAWYLISPRRHRMHRYEAALMCFGLVFNIFGGIMIYLY